MAHLGFGVWGLGASPEPSGMPSLRDMTEDSGILKPRL